MDAVSERHVLRVLTGDVEAVALRTVDRRHRAGQDVSGPDVASGDAHVRESDPGGRGLDDRSMPQQLLGRTVHELGTFAKQRHLVGMGHEQEYRDRQLGSHLLRCHDQVPLGEPRQFLVADLCPVLAHDDTDHPLAGIAALAGRELLGVVDDAHPRRGPLSGEPAFPALPDHPRQLGPVVAGDVEKLTGNERRDGPGRVPDEVDRRPHVLQIVQAFFDDFLDAGPQPFHPPDGVGRGHGPAQPGVVRRVVRLQDSRQQGPVGLVVDRPHGAEPLGIGEDLPDFVIPGDQPLLTAVHPGLGVVFVQRPLVQQVMELRHGIEPVPLMRQGKCHRSSYVRCYQSSSRASTSKGGGPNVISRCGSASRRVGKRCASAGIATRNISSAMALPRQ